LTTIDLVKKNPDFPTIIMNENGYLHSALQNKVYAWCRQLWRSNDRNY